MPGMLTKPRTRRNILTRIGAAAGSAAAYQAMTRLGHAAESDFTGPPNLSGAKGKTRVLVLGAGLAGMLTAYELRRAGYQVRVLEYQDRSGGRNFTLRGGDTLVELGGNKQTVGFSAGNYLNPGPWRIPHHHRGVLHYCKQFGVALEPFIEVNYAALLHNPAAFGGVPQRYGDVLTDFNGYTAELLAKAVGQDKLDEAMGEEERQDLLSAMRDWGILDADDRYKSSLEVSHSRGYGKPRGGGPDGAPTASTLIGRAELMHSRLWSFLPMHANYDMHTTMFQPVGGMDMIGRAFARQVNDLVSHGAKVVKIAQSESGVVVSYTGRDGGPVMQETADWCVCTIPLSILSQIEIQVGPAMQAAIDAVPYHSSVKIGLEFRRRFWEQDEAIYGGISFTKQPISQISYPSTGYHSDGPAVLLGGYMFGSAAWDFAGMTPAERVEAALEQGSALHAQYRREFSNGIGVAWSRMPWSLGCCAMWNDTSRANHYEALTAFDGRIVLAGEHASYIGCWQEGAILSALSAVTRLHHRAAEAT